VFYDCLVILELVKLVVIHMMFNCLLHLTECYSMLLSVRQKYFQTVIKVVGRSTLKLHLFLIVHNVFSLRVEGTPWFVNVDVNLAAVAKNAKQRVGIWQNTDSNVGTEMF
jgi:hypothetical protein